MKNLYGFICGISSHFVLYSQAIASRLTPGNLQDIKLKGLRFCQKANDLDCIVHSRLNNIRSDYEWQYETSFDSRGMNIEILEYGIHTCDWGIIQVDGQRYRFSKKYIQELYFIRQENTRKRQRSFFE